MFKHHTVINNFKCYIIQLTVQFISIRIEVHKNIVSLRNLVRISTCFAMKDVVAFAPVKSVIMLAPEKDVITALAVNFVFAKC